MGSSLSSLFGRASPLESALRQAREAAAIVPPGCPLGSLLNAFLARPEMFTRPSSDFVEGAMLGRGGMGSVVAATDLENRPCAIKRGHPDQPMDVVNEFFVPLAVQEVWTINGGSLDDCPSVRMDKLIVDGDVLAVSMERLQGTVPMDARLPEDQALAVIRRVLDACLCLRAVVPGGAFHCDIKTLNVGLRGGKAILFDFGGVKWSGRPEADWTVFPSECSVDEFGSPAVRKCECDESAVAYLIAHLALSMVSSAFVRAGQPQLYGGACGLMGQTSRSNELIQGVLHAGDIMGTRGKDGSVRLPSKWCDKDLSGRVSPEMLQFFDTFLVWGAPRSLDAVARSPWVSGNGSWAPVGARGRYSQRVGRGVRSAGCLGPRPHGGLDRRFNRAKRRPALGPPRYVY